MHQLLNGWLAELHAILDSFCWWANTSSTPIGVEGVGWWRATVAGKGYVNTENNQMASIGDIFTSAYHTK